MAEQPPAVPPPPDRPSGRPGVVTAAGVLLVIGGVLGVLGGILVLSGAGPQGAVVGALFTFLGLVSIAVGTIQTYAGIQVLNLREVGRTLGIAIAVIGAVFALLSAGRAPGSSILAILIDVFIVYALTQNKQYFTP